jgi:predicted HicB family RNase H-like nuclease
MSKTKTLNLRVSQEFKRKLIEAAARQKRSVTNYLEVVLTDVWDHERFSVSTPGSTTTKKPKA